MVIRQTMLERRKKYFEVMTTYSMYFAIYIVFPAKLEGFSKSGRTKYSYIKLFNII